VPHRALRDFATTEAKGMVAPHPSRSTLEGRLSALASALTADSWSSSSKTQRHA
jgi:hypothetical protein